MNLIFPLTLSCGHLASGTCDCWKGNYVFNPDGDGPIDRVLREFNGAWRQTLEGYGCQLPSGRNHGHVRCAAGKTDSGSTIKTVAGPGSVGNAIRNLEAAFSCYRVTLESQRLK